MDNLLRLIADIQHIMLQRGQTLSTAESCTSGRIASSITSIDGSSGYFQGGLIAYQDHLKIAHLGVSANDIERFDVVSQPVVEQMVRGACALFHTDFALASTGYTGGGTADIPAGTVWIGWGRPGDVHSLCLTGDLGRQANTQRAVDTVLQCFRDYLSDSISNVTL